MKNFMNNIGKNTTLLIESSGDKKWIEIIRDVMNNLGKSLKVTNIMDIDSINIWQVYDLIIIESSSSFPIPEIIRKIRSHDSYARIIVLSTAPNIEEAIEVMLAGAIDYQSIVY